MDEAMRRELLSGPGSSGEPEDQTAGLRGLSDQMDGGFSGVRALQAAGLEAPMELEWVDAEDDWTIEPTAPESERALAGSGLKILAAAAGFFLIAVATRAVFLYLVTDTDLMIPSWSNDTWHRWQIAFLSKDVGFAQDPARLWDLKGLEYYWGVLHPLVLAALFSLTKSVDVMLVRWVTIIAGALNVVFIYLLGRRFWNNRVGIAAALFAILNPIIIFNDPSGMVEPLSFVLLLAGIYFFPSRSLLAGVLLALAAMSRAEAWLMSAGLLLAMMIGNQPSGRKIALGLGWALPVLFYMKHLLLRTGNPIYPIYWNFLANAAGKWQFREEFTDYQLAARPVLVAVFVVASIAALISLWKRPKGYLLYLLGFGATAFITGFIGLTAYLNSYETWFWLTRFFVFPYLFVGLLLAVFFLAWLPSKIRWWDKSGLGPVAITGLLVAVQFSWPSVLHDVQQGYTRRVIASDLREQGEFVAAVYRGGTILIPDTNPPFTYALAHFAGVHGQDIEGQKYGPIYYYEGDDPLSDWESFGPEMWNWFEKENVTTLIIYKGERLFERMITERPERFTDLGIIPRSGLRIYLVNLP